MMEQLSLVGSVTLTLQIKSRLALVAQRARSTCVVATVMAVWARRRPSIALPAAIVIAVLVRKIPESSEAAPVTIAPFTTQKTFFAWRPARNE